MRACAGVELFGSAAPLPPLCSLFTVAMCGYAAALVTTLLFAIVGNAPQPALLYITPGMLVPVVLTAYLRGDLHLLWSGAWSERGGRGE